ncbi:MAG: M15 family metallopeptidase [Candidatus Pacebacteria bacterium]|nr:M15 family metallopeptidase [Candidatus Paceibacterota bacterium]
MRSSASSAFWVLLALAFSCSLTAIALRASADTQCPAGSVAITDATRAAANAAGLPASVQCWNPGDQNTGQAAGDAKLWLQQHATKGSNISCLSPQFAEKLAKFMQAVPGGPPVITSGYRSITEQNSIIARGDGATRVTTACGSYHVWGLAADFNNSNAQQTAWMRANAASYGIATIGAWDPNHFQDAGGRQGQCGVCNASGGNGTLSSAATPSQDDVPPRSVSSQISIPPGYCLASQEPIIAVPCSSLSQPSSGSSSASPQVLGQQPQTIPPSTPSTPTITPTSPLTTPATTSTNIFSNLFQTTPIALPQTSTSAQQALNIITNLGSVATASGSLSLNQNLDRIVNDIIPANATTSQQSGARDYQLPAYTQDTFASSFNSQYSGNNSPTVAGLLRTLQTALGGLLSYLRSL